MEYVLSIPQLHEQCSVTSARYGYDCPPFSHRLRAPVGSLRRCFKGLNKRGDGKLSPDDIQDELSYLGHKVSKKEAAMTIWEVDDDNDGVVDWDEFRTMFYRVRDDQTGCEPRRLFTIVDFLLLDKNHSGACRGQYP